MRSIVTSAILCLVTGLIVYGLVIRLNRKTAVVDAVKLFNGYNMKKDLEGQVKGKLEFLSKQMDSVQNKWRMVSAAKEQDSAKMLSTIYGMLKQKLQDEYTQSNKMINTEVWKRLNPLIESYGKKHGLHLIIGANGMGTVLYEDNYYDMTDDLIKYVNSKYEQGD